MSLHLSLISFVCLKNKKKKNGRNQTTAKGGRHPKKNDAGHGSIVARQF